MADRLDAGARERLDALLADDGEGTAFARLAADPGRVGLESLLAEIGKLELLRGLALPPDLLRGVHPTRSSASAAAPPSRAPGSCAGTPSASACRCSPSGASRARRRWWTAWSSC